VIVEWFLGVLVGLLEGLLGGLPSFAPPSWFTDSGGLFGQMFDDAASMGVWLPVGLGVTIMVAVLTCVGIGFAIKAVRIAASFLTAGGGSAG
jgi:hypothetical protein